MIIQDIKEFSNHIENETGRRILGETLTPIEDILISIDQIKRENTKILEIAERVMKHHDQALLLEQDDKKTIQLTTELYLFTTKYKIARDTIKAYSYLENKLRKLYKVKQEVRT